ncbi:hypothetical protein GCM10023322_29360 [Rugosimonospora acidiphila]|uniref:Clp R domain-containing protein n=1 Tax=Rugosimonospora acidiphila TaxID=556531 RepID=A0ABP9RS91_9ACTN
MRLAARHAGAGGPDLIDSGHLLLGLIDEGGAAAHLLSEAGVSGQAARDQLAAYRAGNPLPPADAALAPSGERTCLAPEARSALEGAVRQSLALSQRDLGPEHLLVGVVGVSHGAAATVLRALGVDLDALTGAARDRAAGAYARAPDPGQPPGASTVTASGTPAGTPEPLEVSPPSLPAGRALAWWYAAIVAIYAVLCLPLVWFAAPAQRILVIVSVLFLPLVGFGSSWLGRSRQRDRVHARLSRDPRLTGLPAPALARALRPYGIAELRVFLADEDLVRNTAWGMGRVSFMRLARATLRVPEAGRFVTAHEAGHVARRDALRLMGATILAVVLLIAGLYSGRVIALGYAVATAVVLRIGAKWAAELGSDAIAVRWVGPATAEIWYRLHRTARRNEPRTPRWYLRRGFAWVQHPPLALRRWYWSRVAVAAAERPLTVPPGT